MVVVRKLRFLYRELWVGIAIFSVFSIAWKSELGKIAITVALHPYRFTLFPKLVLLQRRTFDLEWPYYTLITTAYLGHLLTEKALYSLTLSHSLPYSDHREIKRNGERLSLSLSLSFRPTRDYAKYRVYSLRMTVSLDCYLDLGSFLVLPNERFSLVDSYEFHTPFGQINSNFKLSFLLSLANWMTMINEEERIKKDHSQFPHTKITRRGSCLVGVKLRLYSRDALEILGNLFIYFQWISSYSIVLQ